jgi:hypothetical protein
VSSSMRMIAIVGAVAGALAAYWFLALAPKREQAAQLEATLATKQAQVSEAETTVRQYEGARGAYRRNYATVVRLGKAVPADDDVRSLVVQLDATARRARVDFRNIEVAGGGGAAPPAASGYTPPPGAVQVGAAGFYAMPFMLAFDGRYSNLSRFLTRLERYVRLRNDRLDVTGRLLRLDTVKLSPQPTFANLRAEITASSYLVPPGQGLTGGATAQGPAAAAPATPGSAAPASGGAPPTTTATTTGVTR